MRIALVGKGGSGKTTVAAALARYLVALGRPVLAIDSDINQHLGQALGHDGAAPLALGSDLPWLKDHLRGTNPRIASAEQMIKTTPPGPGSRLLDLDPSGALLSRRRDWVAYHRDTVTFHLRNAEAWGNRAAGTDLAAQVDPHFVPHRSRPPGDERCACRSSSSAPS